MTKIIYVALLLACLAPIMPVAAQDVASGEKLYKSRCAGCHAPEVNRIGPRHKNVVGRRAGSLADYKYSSALSGSGIIWDAKSLGIWLQSPQKMVKGTRMFVSVPKPEDRLHIIAYLATLK